MAIPRRGFTQKNARASLLFPTLLIIQELYYSKHCPIALVIHREAFKGTSRYEANANVSPILGTSQANQRRQGQLT